MPTCTSPIDCDNVEGITPEIAFRKLIQIDANGCPAINTVEVTRPAGSPIQCLPYVDCDRPEADWEALFYKLITVDANGCWALRIIDSAGV
jgi:hypothetical protein